ncbi:hsp90-like protein [Drepanopeziza brunnea f. sp. 'multigermtubi' MB_m1]|uniref:histidine kinase n=1 Tax=Marssonina brunnea f. sp. multigermtubi (strain MB_m1) TaxID=1072389 RepID=K1Y314_MARBU|nr:hsp90-like protein [Drepanopeziza brunnea f. sp. 'multigermtubi' MB_m1]EKD19534.1 hsp90-like protein [Drepanopeziza brunnea f. sp. 'multigermtubi' MB_m1]
MAPIASTIALHLEGVSDSQRAREVYKYYQPVPVAADKPEITEESSDDTEHNRDIKVTSNVTSSKVSSPDTALTAFCQLTTWRLGSQRAMIRLTVDLVDNTKHAPGDDIWIGCAAVSKVGRLCERTIAVKPSGGSYPVFIVDDLSKDDRFNQLPFVAGSPFMRFYAGVPLITKRGIPIGSLFVVDERPGRGLSPEKVHFMGTMAVTIMRHMEMTREVEEHRRGMKMSRGLASFVEGRAELAEAEIEAEDNEGTKIVGQFETENSLRTTRSKGSVRSSVSQSHAGSVAGVDGPEREYSAALSRTEKVIFAAGQDSLQDTPSKRPDLESMAQSQQTSYETSVTISSPSDPNDKSASSPGEEQTEIVSMKLLFSRAANLIREAFEVDGGCIFYDAQTGFGSDKAHTQGPHGDPSSHQESPTSSIAGCLSSDLDSSVSAGGYFSDAESKRRFPAALPALPSQGDGSLEFADTAFSHTTSTASKPCELLGFSTPYAASINSDPMPGMESFNPLEEKTLMPLLTRYPRGKLWNFDSDGGVSSSSDEEQHPPLSSDPLKRSKEMRQRKVKNKQSRSVAKMLAKYFPGVRQLLFIPLWNAGSSRWLSACFAWSTEPTRVLSMQSELSFLSAFGNSVMAEWSRIDTEIADQKKTDFIGSISHELRSPLHGILASAEFLEENSTGWERGLVETIDSCGRTLLDTINHILDYSKINHFEKNWRKNKGRPQGLTGKAGAPLALQQSDLPMLNLFQALDISILCEEVVDSVFAGHVFQHTTAQSFDQVADARGKMADSIKSAAATDASTSSQSIQVSSGVFVILDAECHNYHFTTQPGALRRLIMNLLGNALKYTSHGYVKVSLQAVDTDDFHVTSEGSFAGSENVPRSMIKLVVEDTGRGISHDFLRSKLFMPFAQENSLSSGTGLGLSIVKKIVSLLEGEITIDSEVGRGTRVTVEIPLLREMPRTVGSAASSSTQKSIMSVARDTDDTIKQLQSQAAGYRAALHNFDIETGDPVLRDMGRLLKRSITNFLVKWYGLRIVPLGQKCEIVISNEATPDMISELIAQSSSHKNSPSIVVLSSHSSRFDRNMSISPDINVSFIAKPIGPLKLAKAIAQCLPGAPFIPTPRPEAHSSESSDLSSVFEELTMSPRGGEVLDNSRMAADSDNARKALESPTPSAVPEKHAEFPFPIPQVEEKLKTPPRLGKLGEKLQSSLKLPPRTSSVERMPIPKSVTSEPIPKPLSPQPKAKLDSPTLLLVDDNQINIRLLSTYLTRRNYAVVHEAMDGLQAVNKVDARKEGYDIIFMDITMPVLDGFGATRQIRAIEDRRRRATNPGLYSSSDTIWGSVVSDRKGSGARGGRNEGGDGDGNAALIIAFTGRSSIEDQTEAVRVGIDLFMTKPVAFKEVGKIIDNWVANREKEKRGNLT